MANSGCEKWGAKNAQALHWLHIGYPCVIPKFRSRDTLWFSFWKQRKYRKLVGKRSIISCSPLNPLNHRRPWPSPRTDRSKYSEHPHRLTENAGDWVSKWSIYGIFSSKLPHVRNSCWQISVYLGCWKETYDSNSWSHADWNYVSMSAKLGPCFQTQQDYPITIWSFNMAPWKDPPYFRSVNHLFLWAICTMAM